MFLYKIVFIGLLGLGFYKLGPIEGLHSVQHLNLGYSLSGETPIL